MVQPRTMRAATHTYLDRAVRDSVIRVAYVFLAHQEKVTMVGIEVHGLWEVSRIFVEINNE